MEKELPWRINKEPKPKEVIPQYVQRTISRGFDSIYLNSVAKEEYDRLNREMISTSIPKNIRSMFDLVNARTSLNVVYPEHFDAYAKVLETFEQNPKRVVFSAPPQAGKTFLTTIGLIWIAWTKPQKLVYASYSIDRSREVMRDGFVPILRQLSIPFRVSGNKLYIRSHGSIEDSVILFTSEKGQLTGSSASLIVIDDIIKGDAESLTPGNFKKVWNWFRTNVLTRERKNLAVVVMMTRWNVADLSGQILQELPNTEHIRIPAICDDADSDILGRKVGEAIEFRTDEIELNLEFFERKRKEVGEYIFSCMYQGTPSETVNLVHQISTYDTLPPSKNGYHTVYGADIAYTTNHKRDYSTIVKLKVNLDTGDAYVIDYIKKQCLWQDFVPIMLHFSQEAGRIHWHCSALEQKTVGDEIQRKIKTFVPKPTQKPKTVRAVETANALNNGWLKFPSSSSEEWQYFKSQLLVFDGSGVGNDDCVDALVSAYDSVKHLRGQILNRSYIGRGKSMKEREEALRDARTTLPTRPRIYKGRSI